jgi:hypothetical protein
MDPFDEFEFKPITEGLGFHKKSVQFKKELDSTRSMPAVSMPLKQPTQAPTEKRFSTQNPMQPQLPQERKFSTTHAPVAPNRPSLPFHEFIESPKKEQAPPWTAPVARSHEARTQIRRIEEVPVSIPAIIFDTVVVMGLTCLFAIAVLLIVDVDLINILQIARDDFMTSLSLVLLCVSVLELYLIIFRSFLGATLGEWAFEVQLGSKTEQDSSYYPFRVILRSIIIIATGFITLPLLSLITGRDLAGRIAGISLRRGEPIG